MHKILFVCLGNICRSVTAEEVMRQMVINRGLQDRFELDSAGLIDYHEGELADARMRDHAYNRGYRLTHRSRPVRQEDFHRFDLILAMDDSNIQGLRYMAPDEESAQKIGLLANYLRHHDNSSIPDPYYGGAKGFELVLDLLEDAIEGLLQELELEANA